MAWVLRWRWSLAWYASWDLRTSISWARFVSQALDLAHLETQVTETITRVCAEWAPHGV